MRYTIIIFLLIILFYSCGIKTERIEIKLMDCNKLAFIDEGKQLKELMIDYESNLIKSGIIANNSGKSYLETISKIADGVEFKNRPFYSFGEMLNGIRKNNSTTSNNCLQQVLIDSSKYDFKQFSKFQKILKKTISSSQDLRIELLAKVFSNVLTEKDFELDLYRMKVYLLFDMLRSDNILNSESKKNNYDNENALQIYLNSKNEIFIGNKEFKINDLKYRIINYYRKNKTKSVIIIKSDRETMYSDYINVENEIENTINLLQNDLSNEKFGKNYADLNNEELKFINKQYPKSIIQKLKK
ncbi:ExbD/TolR family protein [Tenacibaculum sp. nBUS_03]|uniref:ExbD/TolR family protein n=1 Tax=Tenacibaculum sp. nBUS_03 TaxID=3395320 RepID=UPI003EBCB601